MKAVAFIIIVLVAVIALIFIWKQMPTKESMPTPTSTSTQAVVTQDGLTKVDCEATKGHWVDCGGQSCQPQCQCGGIAGWACPTGLLCTDLAPAGAADALGICRKTETSSTQPMTDVRPVPEGMICGEQNAICVSKDLVNASVSNPIEATGTARVFENQFSWKIQDAKGVTVVEGNIMASSTGDDPSAFFSIRTFLTSVPKTATGTLVLFDNSAKDGAVIDTLNLPIKFPTKTADVTLYVSPKKTGTDCAKTAEEIVTIPKSSLPVEASIRTLIASEKTAIPKGTQLKSIALSKGTLNLIFSSELDGGGSCRITAIRAQIEKTAMQNSNVKKVVISVEGKTPEESLQP
ncbi:MAG: Gmad2 immunoglobulin-like domain-containing protein [bacterium]|nr:Gmad2 immunoglobulin-like domain-containing protein [bacterium]